MKSCHRHRIGAIGVDHPNVIKGGDAVCGVTAGEGPWRLKRGLGAVRRPRRNATVQKSLSWVIGGKLGEWARTEAGGLLRPSVGLGPGIGPHAALEGLVP